MPGKPTGMDPLGGYRSPGATSLLLSPPRLQPVPSTGAQQLCGGVFRFIRDLTQLGTGVPAARAVPVPEMG